MRTVLTCALLAALSLHLLPGVPKTLRAPEEKGLVLLVEKPQTGALPKASASAPERACTEDAQTLTLLTDGALQTLSMQEYLTGVLLSEMPPDFAPEARKAQAVAARTFTAKRRLSPKHEAACVCADAACCQAWTSRPALEEKYGARFDEVWQAAQKIVMQTAGEVLFYDGALIDAVYFSCSGGKTEPAAAVWGTDIPYLQAVESPGEQDAPRYESQAVFQADEFAAILRAENNQAKLSGAPEGWLGKATRSEGGGITEYEIGGVSFSGPALRRMFSLRSTNFSVSYQDGAFYFEVLGFGHRVGLSQYGAQAMAELGFSYRTILQYYYRGVTLGQSV